VRPTLRGAATRKVVPAFVQGPGAPQSPATSPPSPSASNGRPTSQGGPLSSAREPRAYRHLASCGQPENLAARAGVPSLASKARHSGWTDGRAGLRAARTHVNEDKVRRPRRRSRRSPRQPRRQLGENNRVRDSLRPGSPVGGKIDPPALWGGWAAHRPPRRLTNENAFLSLLKLSAEGAWIMGEPRVTEEPIPDRVASRHNRGQDLAALSPARAWFRRVLDSWLRAAQTKVFLGSGSRRRANVSLRRATCTWGLPWPRLLNGALHAPPGLRLTKQGSSLRWFPKIRRSTISEVGKEKPYIRRPRDASHLPEKGRGRHPSFAARDPVNAVSPSRRKTRRAGCELFRAFNAGESVLMAKKRGGGVVQKQKPRMYQLPCLNRPSFHIPEIQSPTRNGAHTLGLSG